MNWALLATLAATNPALAPVPPERATQPQLNRIADKCGMPRKSLKLWGQGQVHFKPSKTAKYEAVDCVLAELKTAYYPSVDLGFVGNEAPEPKAQ